MKVLKMISFFVHIFHNSVLRSKSYFLGFICKLSIWPFHLKLWSKCTPKYLKPSTTFKMVSHFPSFLPWRQSFSWKHIWMFCCGTFLLLKCIIFVLFWLITSSLSSQLLVTILNSCGIVKVASFMSLCVTIMAVSSAYVNDLLRCIFWVISFVYMRYSIGPNFEPFGTPYVVVLHCCLFYQF